MRIGILGAGWLGTPLAHFLKDNDHQVKVSVRSVEKQNKLQNQGLQTHLLHLTEDKILGDLSFFESIDVLIVSLTPQAIELFKHLISEIIQWQIPKVILFSSTGIYADCEGVVTETSLLKTDRPKVALLKSIEELFLQNNEFTTTVLRLGGLIGPDRHPVHYLAKKDIITDGNEPVNILYQYTLLTIVVALLQTKMSHTVFNVVEKEHRSKEAFYTEAAIKLGLSLPPFSASLPHRNRVVSTEKIESFLNIKTPI